MTKISFRMGQGKELIFVLDFLMRLFQYLGVGWVCEVDWMLILVFYFWFWLWFVYYKGVWDNYWHKIQSLSYQLEFSLELTMFASDGSLIFVLAVLLWSTLRDRPWLLISRCSKFIFLPDFMWYSMYSY